MRKVIKRIIVFFMLIYFMIFMCVVVAVSPFVWIISGKYITNKIGDCGIDYIMKFLNK